MHVTVAASLAPLPLFTAHCVASAKPPPLIEINHCQEDGDVPVDGIVPVTTNAWSASKAVALTVGPAGEASGEPTHTVGVAADCRASGA